MHGDWLCVCECGGEVGGIQSWGGGSATDEMTVPLMPILSF